MREHWREKGREAYTTPAPTALMDLNDVGALPTRNFQDGAFEGRGQDHWRACVNHPTGREAAMPPHPLQARGRGDDDEYDVDPIYGGPEYETRVHRLQLRIDDLRAIAKGHEICNAMGLDTITAHDGVVRQWSV